MDYFEAAPSLLQRTDSDSSTGSTVSHTVGTPTDRITHRVEGDFGGEPGLTIDQLVAGIKDILMQDPLVKFKIGPTCTNLFLASVVTWKIRPPLVQSNKVLQLRMTEEEVDQLVEKLKEDHAMQVDTKPVWLSKYQNMYSGYVISVPADVVVLVGFQEAAPLLERNVSGISLHDLGTAGPRPIRPVPEDEDEETIAAAGDLKVNADSDADALYI